MTVGIYKITNKVNKKAYIGQSINIEERWKQHKQRLKSNRHHNSHLQNAWNKYKEKSFTFCIIEKCNIEDLNDKEQYWIKKCDSYNSGYNLDKGGEGVLGYKKNIYRVIKKGTNRYQLVNPDSCAIKTSILQNDLNILCEKLNKEEITENEALSIMKQKEKEYRRENGYKILETLGGVDYLVLKSKEGYGKQDIINLHNISTYSFNNFLKDNNINWHGIVTEAYISKIHDYDKKYNIQEQLNSGKTINQIRKNIGCTISSFEEYRKKNNIIKAHSNTGYKKRTTNTGVRHVSFISKMGKYQYRRTKNNKNNIVRGNLLDLEKAIKEKGLEWIIDDEKTFKDSINKSYILQQIKNNKKKGKTIAKQRKLYRKKQKFAKKRALKVFRALFRSQKRVIITNKRHIVSPVGVSNVRFSTGDNSWNFRKKDKKGQIKRQNLVDLYKEVVSQGYSWEIENNSLLHCAIKEVKIFREERKKPFFERKKDFKTI